MKTTSDPHDGVLAYLLSKFDYEKELAALKVACDNKYGLKPVPGKNVSYFTPKQLAEYRNVSTKTLERERKNGGGPAFKKLTGDRQSAYER